TAPNQRDQALRLRHGDTQVGHIPGELVGQNTLDSQTLAQYRDCLRIEADVRVGGDALDRFIERGVERFARDVGDYDDAVSLDELHRRRLARDFAGPQQQDRA